MPFTPWTTIDGYRSFLDRVEELGIVANIAPVQYAHPTARHRQLAAAGAPDIVDLLEPFDETALFYPWRHPDPAVDELHEAVIAVVANGAIGRGSAAATSTAKCDPSRGGPPIDLGDEPDDPALSEPWYCCAEPTSEQLARL